MGFRPLRTVAFPLPPRFHLYRVVVFKDRSNRHRQAVTSFPCHTTRRTSPYRAECARRSASAAGSFPTPFPAMRPAQRDLAEPNATTSQLSSGNSGPSSANSAICRARSPSPPQGLDRRHYSRFQDHPQWPQRTYPPETLRDSGFRGRIAKVGLGAGLSAGSGSGPPRGLASLAR